MEKKEIVIHPHLCKGCIEMLEEDNPYIYPVEPVEVPLEECDNYTKDGEFVNLPAAEKRFKEELEAQGVK